MPSVDLCLGYACTRSITIRDRTLKFDMWNNYANKMTIFFVAFGVSELQPFIKSFVLISHYLSS